MSEKPRYWDCCEAGEVETCGCKECTLIRKQTKQKIIDRLIRAIRNGEEILSSSGPEQKFDVGTPNSVYFWIWNNGWCNVGWLHTRQVKHLSRFHGLKLSSS